ncbi:hypothetical protein [Streptomyces phytohabitans]|uniref:hypothetical protein n=1 Tax=Streptomyces phytohabitans TaxID=1150371 RepID=UPI00345B81EA
MPLADPAVLFLLAATFGYAGLCAVSPFGNCRKCRGFGFHVKRSRLSGRLKPGRVCRRCRGDRVRIRTGRHLWNTWCRTYRDGTR